MNGSRACSKPHQIHRDLSAHARRLLWIDACAAAAAGIFVLVLCRWLAVLHGFSLNLELVLGAVNLIYAAYSGTLARRTSLGKKPPRSAFVVLVIANGLWTVVCLILAVLTWPYATLFGFAHLTLEGIFVGSLAVQEYRYLVKAAD